MAGLSTILGTPGGASGATSGKTASLATSTGSQPFVVYDSAEIERVKAEQQELDALLRSDLEEAVGPSKTEISDAWAEAIMYLNQNPGETVYVSHDIDNADLATLVNKFEQVGVLEPSESVGTIQTRDSSVTFAQGPEGWLFFRAAGNA